MKRLLLLDFSRLIAAVIVLNSHFIGAFGFPIVIDNHIKDVLSFFWNGEYAINYFFVLSGFVLSFKYFQTNIDISLKDFYIKRIFRIYPLYIFCLLICAFLIHFKDHMNLYPTITESWIEQLMIKPIFIKDICIESLLIFNVSSISKHLIIPPSWTLSIEALYSLLIPFFIFIARKSTIWLLVLTLVLSKLFFLGPNAISFAFGVLLAKIYTYYPSIRLKKGLFVLPILGIMIVYLSRKLHISWLITYGDIISSVFIIMYFLYKKESKQWQTNKWIINIINSSYGVYLCHIIIIKFLSPFIFYKCNLILNVGTWAMTYLLTLMITIFISTILFITIEKYFVKIGELFNKKYSYIKF